MSAHAMHGKHLSALRYPRCAHGQVMNIHTWKNCKECIHSFIDFQPANPTQRILKGFSLGKMLQLGDVCVCHRLFDTTSLKA